MNNSPSSNQPAQSASRSSSPSRQSANYSAQKGLSSGVKNAAPNDSQRRISNMDGRSANMRIDNNNVLRIPPRERDRILDYDRPANFYVHDHHYFGYRIHSLPPSPHHFVHWGVDYYYYNHVYYRPWGGVYVVCRPPFGVCIDIALTQASLCAIRFSYFNNVYRTYREIDDNYRLIDQQNRTIAQNNALIASQNAAIALNANRAATAYELADRLGLVQSYANSTSEYFYEDGVFFIENSKGQYEVIVPPAGALVSELPDDYETITLDGTEFYKVDDTVYRLTLVDGTPYLEVLGQMTSRVAKKYGF